MSNPKTITYALIKCSRNIVRERVFSKMHISCSNVQYTWLSAANSKNSRILIGNSDTSPYRLLIVLINNLVNNLQFFVIYSLVEANIIISMKIREMQLQDYQQQQSVTRTGLPYLWGGLSCLSTFL